MDPQLSLDASPATDPAGPENAWLAAKLEEVAELLETQAANPFRVRAYRRAAAALRRHPEGVSAPLAARGPSVQDPKTCSPPWPGSGRSSRSAGCPSCTPSGRHDTALHSNTARAHELGATHDWVVIYRDDHEGHGQWTVVSARRGALAGRRVVRGRELRCAALYGLESSAGAP